MSYFTVRYLVALRGRGERHRLQEQAVFPLSWLATADEVIDLLRSLTAASGTKRTCRHAAHMLVESLPVLTPMVFGSIHATCLLALVTDGAMKAWYHSSIA